MRRSTPLILIGSVSIVVIALIMAVGDDTDDQQRPGRTQVDEIQPIVANETDPAKGPVDAKVAVIVLSSFACPACRDTAQQMDQLRALYPESVRIVWKDLPDSVGDAYTAAIAARCAQLQGRFWQYHDALYAHQDALADRSLYATLASDLRLSATRFDQCLDRQETKAWVDANIAQALQAGVGQVPHVQIGDQVYDGPQTLSFYRSAVDAILEN